MSNPVGNQQQPQSKFNGHLRRLLRLFGWLLGPFLTCRKQRKRVLENLKQRGKKPETIRRLAFASAQRLETGHLELEALRQRMEENFAVGASAPGGSADYLTSENEEHASAVARALKSIIRRLRKKARRLDEEIHPPKDARHVLPPWPIFFLEHLRLYYSYVYFGLFGLCALGPGIVVALSGDSELVLVLGGLNVLLVTYLFDFLQLSAHRVLDRRNRAVVPLHILIVAWLLPFLLTTSPYLQHVNQQSYYLMLLGVDNRVTDDSTDRILPLDAKLEGAKVYNWNGSRLVQTEENASDVEKRALEQSDSEVGPPSKLQAWLEASLSLSRSGKGQSAAAPSGPQAKSSKFLEQLTEECKRAENRGTKDISLLTSCIVGNLDAKLRVPSLVYTLLFSSLVVLLPLELFSLFFLRDKTKRYMKRHALITAGCLDVATLFFLLILAPESAILRLSADETLGSAVRPMLIGYLLALFIASFIASFRAIYVAQYREELQDAVGAASAG